MKTKRNYLTTEVDKNELEKTETKKPSKHLWLKNFLVDMRKRKKNFF